MTFTTPTLSKQQLQSYLKLKLDANTQAVISMKQMQEVLIVARERITPIPNLTDCVIGLLNQRSRVFWVIDLANLLELTPIDTDIREYNIAIVRVGNISMGLAVEKVQGVTRLVEDEIQSITGNILPGLTPYLKGCILDPQDKILLVLDAAAIVNSPLFRAY